MYCYNGAQRYKQLLQVGRLYRALILIGLAVYLPSSSVSFVFTVLYIYINFLLTSFSLPFSERGPSGIGPWPGGLTIVLQCRDAVGLGLLTRKIVSEMTYNVSNGR